MLKLLRKRSFRRSKRDFRTESNRRQRRRSSSDQLQEASNSSGHYSNKSLDNPSFVPSGQVVSVVGNSDSRFSSLDRRSQNTSYRYSSVSSSTKGLLTAAGENRTDSPPEILQYARPPENLTSPVRESNGLLHQSLTPSPSLIRQTQQSKIESAEKSTSEYNKKAEKRLSKPESRILSSFRRSFRKSKSAQKCQLEEGIFSKNSGVGGKETSKKIDRQTAFPAYREDPYNKDKIEMRNLTKPTPLANNNINNGMEGDHERHSYMQQKATAARRLPQIPKETSRTGLPGPDNSNSKDRTTNPTVTSVQTDSRVLFSRPIQKSSVRAKVGKLELRSC